MFRTYFVAFALIGAAVPALPSAAGPLTCEALPENSFLGVLFKGGLSSLYFDFEKTVDYRRGDDLPTVIAASERALARLKEMATDNTDFSLEGESQE